MAPKGKLQKKSSGEDVTKEELWQGDTKEVAEKLANLELVDNPGFIGSWTRLCSGESCHTGMGPAQTIGFVYT